MSRILLLGCVSRKHDRPSPAADLYASPLWSKRPNYANETGRTWFSLSALHGLLDQETVIEPYEVSFPDLKGQAAKKARAARVFADLQQAADIDGTVFEFHAGLDYQKHLVPLIESAGGVCTYPCESLGVGEQLRWYDQHDPIVDFLTDPVNRVPAADFGNRDRHQLNEAGLYAWFADDTARQVVQQRLGVECPELIYAGLTGATKWPSGKQSTPRCGNGFGGSISAAACFLRRSC